MPLLILHLLLVTFAFLISLADLIVTAVALLRHLQIL